MKSLRNVSALLLLLFIVGCVTANIEMSHEKGFIWASNIYTAQYNLYLDRILKKDLPIETKIAVKADPRLITQDMVRTDLTAAQKTLLADRKKIFTFVYPALMAWGQYVRTGMVDPSYKDIQQIEAFVTNTLTTLLQGGDQW